MAISAFYEDELAYLRELGAEFARANPKLAPFLGREATDPDVERLLEGFAFLAARLRERLDDELPELSHGLARLIWPHYLRPIPPMTILAFEAVPAGSQAVVRIPAGVQVRSRPIDGVTCPFATAYPLEVLPLALSGVQVENRPTSARLSFRLKAVGKAAIDVLAGRKLRLFFNAERDPQTVRTLLLWLSRNVRQIECASEGGSRIVLGQSEVRPVGFSDDEAVLPWPGNSFSGFRLLQEYLNFPTKFMFVDLVGFEPLAVDRSKGMSIVIDFNRPFPDQFRVADGQIVLNCTPAVNLFSHDANPVRTGVAKSEYRVTPLGGGAYSLHSIEEATGHRQGRAERQVYAPFESFRHDLPGSESQDVYFRHRLRPAVVGRGADSYISFVTRQDQQGSPAEIVSIKLKCSNGPLADRIAVGSVDQPTAETPGGVTVSNIIGVTAEIAAPIGDNLLWRLVANLARNYGSLVDVGALRSLIAAYDFKAVNDAQARRRLELLLESLNVFETAAEDTVLRGIPARMRRITLSIAESKLGGEAEMFLFGAVLDAFFSAYASLNSLHQFAVKGLEGKAIFEWPMRAGRSEPS
jgi:type VI secretion system protein ImpG